MGMKPLTAEEKAERASAQKASARQAMADYQAERLHQEENGARLKALRLARDAQEAAKAKAAPAVAKKRPTPTKPTRRAWDT